MQLAEMGFPLEACRKAVYYTGNMGPEMAFNWIIAHMEEPGKKPCTNHGNTKLRDPGDVGHALNEHVGLGQFISAKAHLVYTIFSG